jgi:hypothetical protein
VTDAFKSAGVEIAYQAPRQLDKGIVGADLIFRMSIPAAPANQYFQGPTPVSYTLGSGTATVNLTPTGPAVATSAAGGLLPGGLGPTGIAPPPAGIGLGGPTPTVIATGGQNLDSTQLPNLPAPTGPATVAGPAPGPNTVQLVTDQPALRAESRASTVRTADVDGVYRAIVAAAAVALAAAVLLRALGVRFLWS